MEANNIDLDARKSVDAVDSGEIIQTTTHKREKGNAGRCTKKSSKATYAKKRKYHRKRENNVNMSTKKSRVIVPLQKVKKVKKVPNKILQNVQGFRLLDMQILQDIISDLCCPECNEKGTFFAQENDDKKKRISSHLTVSCECGYEKATCI